MIKVPVIGIRNYENALKAEQKRMQESLGCKLAQLKEWVHLEELLSKEEVESKNVQMIMSGAIEEIVISYRTIYKMTENIKEGQTPLDFAKYLLRNHEESLKTNND